jgi:hypothetical protein
VVEEEEEEHEEEEEEEEEHEVEEEEEEHEEEEDSHGEEAAEEGGHGDEHAEEPVIEFDYISTVLGHVVQTSAHGHNYSYFANYDSISLLELYLSSVIKPSDSAATVDPHAAPVTPTPVATDSHSSGHRVLSSAPTAHAVVDPHAAPAVAEAPKSVSPFKGTPQFTV